jgi:hypothetical protein
MGGECSTCDSCENFTLISGGKTEGKRLYVRRRFTWEDNIKIDLIDVGWWDVN